MESSHQNLRTALVAGATGLVGRALVRALLASGRYGVVHALLRRTTNDLADDVRLRQHVVDFAAPQDLPSALDVYIALGTTIKAAGSQAAFRRVDLDYVVHVAQAALRGSARRLGVVSAHGADTGSRVFYNRVKGEMEEVVSSLPYESVALARPSLLLGDRAALGQGARLGEGLAQSLLAPLSRLVPASVRPIRAEHVASALLEAVLEGRAGVRVLSSREMQRAP